MIDTAGTICNAANALKEFGAKEVYACCTHGVLSGPAMERLIASPIKEIVVLDTINLPENVRNCPKVKVVSCAKLIAKAITSIYSDSSLSAIFPILMALNLVSYSLTIKICLSFSFSH